MNLNKLKRKTQEYRNFSALEISNSEHPEAVIIFLHGLGATGHDFEDVPARFQLTQKFAVKYIFPHAPLRPVTLNQGLSMPAWYDIFGLEFNTKEDSAGIYATAAMINALIEQQIAAKIPAQKIILGGFSQGGALALHCGLRFPQVLAGILALSTYLPIAQTIPSEISVAGKKTPIFLAHGSYDEVLPASWAQYSVDQLKHNHCTVELKLYPMAHTLCGKELTDIDRWVASRWQEPV